jgi:sulfate permease, SulP family
VILVVAAPLAKNIPLAALSAVLVVVSLRMGEWHQFRRLKRWPKSDAAVFLCAFTLTVCIDLPTAVGASLILASALLVRQLSELTHIHPEEEVPEGSNNRQTIEGRQIPDGVMACIGRHWPGRARRFAGKVTHQKERFNIVRSAFSAALCLNALRLH